MSSLAFGANGRSVALVVILMKKTARSGGGRKDPKLWTIAVFMVGEPEILFSMRRDLIELQSVGSSDDVDVVVAQQETAGSKTKFFLIPQGAENRPSKPQREGDPTDGPLEERLDKFLQFVLQEHPAKHYLLVLWGHASGLGFGQLEPRSGKDLATLDELGKSLEKFRREREGKKLDILGFCACALSKVEFALELRDEVDFLVSSQIGISTLMTWPFDEILERVVSSPTVAPASLASQIVRCFEDSYEPPPVALTALNLEEVGSLTKTVNAISEAILNATAGLKLDELSQDALNGLLDPDSALSAAAFKKLPAGQQAGFLNYLSVFNAFTLALDAFPYEHEELVDFFDFCRKLAQQTTLDTVVRVAARKVTDRGPHPFVFQNARSGPKLGALNGLSIIAPDFNNKDWATTWEPGPGEKQAWFWGQTRWPEMARKVHEFASRLPPEFLEDT